MKSSVLKRSVVIDGHKTSISLEEPFWTGLKNIADTQHIPVSKLIAKIDLAREQPNLSSALRLFVLERFRNENQANGSGESTSFSAVRAENTKQANRV